MKKFQIIYGIGWRPGGDDPELMRTSHWRPCLHVNWRRGEVLPGEFGSRHAHVPMLAGDLPRLIGLSGPRDLLEASMG